MSGDGAGQEGGNRARGRTRAPAVVFWLVLAEISLHLATAARYGIFRDELYYLACAQHLDWGYVDHPPLIVWVTWLVAHTLGTSLVALRLLPALAGGGLVWLTASLARAMDGGRFAQGLAAFAVIPVPIWLILHHWLTMNAFEPLLWTGVLWWLVRLIETREPVCWIWMGVLAGIGCETKYSMVLCAGGVLLGLALSPERRLLRNPWLLAGTACALLLFLPNLLWLVAHHFPFLEFERNSRQSDGRIVRGPVAFLWDQVVMMNPVLAPLWVGGAGWLLVRREGRRVHAVGWACVLILLGLLLLKAKNYYAAPLYPVLLAAGAVGLERVTTRRRGVRIAYVGALVLSGLVLAPLVMPLLAPPVFVRYQAALGGWTPVTFERLTPTALPQYFADEFGWEQMARSTARVYAELPAAERVRTAIFANDYGQAAAIDYFGPALGLPPAISKSESFWLWGPRGYTGDSVIVLGSDGSGDREHFRSVEAAGQVANKWARADERFTIFVCRGLTRPLAVLWPLIKSW